MRDVEIAWAAGVFEGEGSVTSTGRSAARASVEMSDLDVLERLQHILGGRVNGPRQRGPRRKPMYRWEVSSRGEVLLVLRLLLPWLGDRRRARAEEVIAHILYGQRECCPICGEEFDSARGRTVCSRRCYERQRTDEARTGGRPFKKIRAHPQEVTP